MFLYILEEIWSKIGKPILLGALGLAVAFYLINQALEALS